MIKVNLLPGELRKKKKTPIFDRFLLYIILILGFVSFSLWFQNMQQLADIAELKSLITQTEDEIMRFQQQIKMVEETRALKDKITERTNAIQLIDAQRSLWVDVLADFSGLIPEFLWLDEFVEVEKVVTLKGKCYNLKGIASLIVGLIKSDYFDQVRLNYIREQTSDKQTIPIYSFDMAGTITYNQTGQGVGGQFIVDKPFEKEEGKKKTGSSLVEKGREALSLDRDKAKRSVQGLGK
jgi:Tfp pilus assembly protein PilN